jgi:hypothetical protein
MKYYAFDGKAIERILKARFSPRILESMAARSASKIFSSLPQIKQRPLEDYCHFIKEACHGRQYVGQHPQTSPDPKVEAYGPGVG